MVEPRSTVDGTLGLLAFETTPSREVLVKSAMAPRYLNTLLAQLGGANAPKSARGMPDEVPAFRGSPLPRFRADWCAIRRKTLQHCRLVTDPYRAFFLSV